MAESESIDCPCSNIAIMQLFHELKQSYPSVPDQIVSKIIQENYHDKSACETILQKESHIYLQSYPGAIISGNSRDSGDRSSLCNHCPASRPPRQGTDVTHPLQCAMPNNRTQTSQKQEEDAFSSSEGSGIYSRGTSETDDGGPPRRSEPRSRQASAETIFGPRIKKGLSQEKIKRKAGNCDKKVFSASSIGKTASESSIGKTDTKASSNGCESSSLNSSRTCCSDCDSERKESTERSHSRDTTPSVKGSRCGEVETVRWKVEDAGSQSKGSSGVFAGSSSAGQMTVHNYQVAVQYSMQPALPLRQGDQQRSFTTVNLSLRPPSSEPQPPIEIQSGQDLTYTTSVFDAKKGVQSQLQIRITPGGGGTVSACRTYISSPHVNYSCRSPYCTPRISTGCHCQNNHHLKALLEKQRERKDLLARELRKEKEKLRRMQNDIRLMKASIALKPSPHLLPKLKAENERLRAECERLTAAVDLYSDTQHNLPLGETDEEFYRNIYTGQRLQREGSWSCQLCTFRNHPLLSVCEECEMPRISLGTQVMDVASRLSNVLSNNNTSFCSGGGTSTSASLITAPLQSGSQVSNEPLKMLLTGKNIEMFGRTFMMEMSPMEHIKLRRNGEQLGGLI